MRSVKFAMMSTMTLISGLAIVAHAAPGKNLPGEILLNCQLKDKVYTNNLDYVLNKITQKQIPQVYFIKNKSNYTLVLDHSVNGGSAKAGWSSYLSPGKWSALAVSQTGFAVRCMINNQGKYYQGGCGKLISVCQPSNGATIKSSGNYWVAENQTWDDFIKIMQKKDVLTGKLS